MNWADHHHLLVAQLTGPDYFVLVVYVLVVVAVGSWLGRGQSSLTDYFLAERRTHWLVACVSIVATDLSAISYMGMPAWMVEHDLKLLCGNILTPITFSVVALLVLPVFFRMKVFTVYEYLEHRFHPSARTVTAVLFLLQRGVWLAAAIYIPSVALGTFTGIPIIACVLVIGTLTTLYTVLGGMKAVLWTDFLQFIVMMGGLGLMIGIQLKFFGWDFGRVWTRASEMTAPATGTPYTTWIDGSLNLKTEATAWALVLFYFVYHFGTYGTDQVVVQRYFTMKTLGEAVQSIMSSSLLTVGVVALLGVQGLLLVVYYDAHPDLAATLPNADSIVPHFAATVLPAGARGLVFAAIFSATMSSVSAGLNAVAAVGIMDLYRRHVRPRRTGEAHMFRIAKLCTLACGALATLGAVWISTTHTTILQTLIGVASKFVGPISGIFLMGLLTKRANVVGVYVGAALGLTASFLVDLPAVAERVNWLWTAPLASLVTFVAGYIVSLCVPAAGAGMPSRTRERRQNFPRAGAEEGVEDVTGRHPE